MKNFIVNIIRLTIGNGFKLVSSVLLSFILPMFFSVENYGLFRLFVLYTSYVGFFHFGFNDGVYLKYGGTRFVDLDRKTISKTSAFLIIFQILIASIFLIFSFFLFSGERKVIMIFLSLNIISNNVTGYFLLISQATSRFKEYSMRSIIQSLFTIAIIALLFFLKIDNYFILILAITLSNYILMFWYIFTYRDIVFAVNGIKNISLKDNLKHIVSGMPLLLSNFILILILNTSKQLVDMFFDIETFAYFSFAYSLMSFLSIFISAISTVIYPYLMKVDKDSYSKIYEKTYILLILIVFGSLLLIYPIQLFVLHFLPNYHDSLLILKIVFPTLLFTTPIMIIKHNFYKAHLKSIEFLKASSIALILGVGLNLFAYYAFKNVIFIAVFSVLSMLIWYILTDVYMKKFFKINLIKGFTLVLLGIAVFYLCQIISNIYISVLIYLILFIIITLVYGKKMIVDLIKGKHIV